MTTTVARYVLWALLCIPVLVLGMGLCTDLLDGVLKENREKKAKKEAEKAKQQKRSSFEEEYRKTHKGEY